MTRRLTATIGVGALVVTGAAFAAFPATASEPESASHDVEISIGQAGRVNLAGTGLVPVVIHGADGVDPTTVDPASITVGGDVQTVRSSGGQVIATIVDMDADGRDDLVVHVDQADLRHAGGLTSDVEQLAVSATADGDTLAGVATVRPEVVLELKFVEALQVSGSGTDVHGAQGQSLPGVDAALASYDADGLTPFLTQAAAQRLTANLAETQDAAAQAAPDLASWYTLTLPADTDVTQALDTLRALPAIGFAGHAPGMAPPPAAPAALAASQQPATPDFRGAQRYFRTAAENGIDADFSRADPRIRGEGIKIVDLEYDWNEHHEDLQLPDPGTDVGGDAFEKYKGFNDQHGTAVLGILGALDNDFGITGGVPEAELYGISPVRANGGYAPGPALAYLAALQDESGASFLQPGDAVLLEQQGGQVIPNADCPVRPGTCYSPLEWNVAVHQAVSLLISMGVTVVATGGNGYNSTDNPAYTRDGLPWFRAENSSGSIFEGAGDADSRERLAFSNHGPRFDLQGWGHRITTTGHGGTSTSFWPTTGGGDPATLNYRYTGSFGGTSGGGPIVTTAVVAIQSYRLATGQKPWSAQRIADLLKATGQAQGPNSAAQHVGPLPNIRAALIEIEVDRPETTLLLDGQPPQDRSYDDPMVSLDATDGWGAGVNRTMYRIDDIPRWFTYHGPFQVTGAGEHTIQYRSNDVNHNTERTKVVTFTNAG
jgi:subtilase family protein